MKNSVKLLSLLLVLCMLLCSCAQGGAAITNSIVDGVKENNNLNNVISSLDATNDACNEQLSASNTNDAIPEKGTYNEGVVLVKYVGEFTENILSQLDFVSAEPFYSGSSWYTVKLGSSMDTVEAVEYLTALCCFDKVDYDYVMTTGADTDSVVVESTSSAAADVAGNPDYESQKKYLDTHRIPDGWDYLKENDKNPGGSSDVIIAVIDTGVDYNHLDLRNNIWVNPAEIPDNGIDDDGNGYVDDIHGWDCVNNDNDPMDDNGHGTHVAGIIAAENNNIGGVGVAYNCKVMVLKAGNSSGYFNNSDIAEAIQYAYMNGASVINMSFGGSQISIAVEEGLENAYNTCVLVAAAGNSGLCNEPNHDCPGVPFFPAALPYVIGVMSCNKSGTSASAFSNYDHYPYNSYEYEVFAVGEGVFSTWPNNKYATLNGTSMAAPMVSGIAALLRSEHHDRETYSTKYLQSQIVNTGELLWWEKSVANAYDALAKVPTPSVNLYDYYIDDNVSISSVNNGNGVLDAGETVHLYISLQNKGGVASNVNVSIDAIRNNDSSLTDPYFTFVNTTIQLSDIGTYSVRECYDDQYFEIIVSPDCPNDYLTDFNIRYTYKNGLDENDQALYEDDGRQLIQFNVANGYHLPSVILEDTIFSNDRLYIVSEDVTIPVGVEVTFEEGCRIQFYDDRKYYTSPVIRVYGALNVAGTKEAMVSIAPNERHLGFTCKINVFAGGTLSLNYVNAIDLNVVDDNCGSHSNLNLRSLISNSYLMSTNEKIKHYSNGNEDRYSVFEVGRIENCYIDVSGITLHAVEFDSNFIVIRREGTGIYPGHQFISRDGKFTNNIVYNSHVWDTQYIQFTYTAYVSNNMFITEHDINLKSLVSFQNCGSVPTFSGNSFAKIYQMYANQIIAGYIGGDGVPTIDIYGACNDVSKLYPHIVSAEILNANGEQVSTVGNEEIKVRITFNRPMDTTKNTYVSFGSVAPYDDYRIYGEWISDTVWVGTYTLKTQIENGQNFFKVNNACAAENQVFKLPGTYQLCEFTIDTTKAMSMNLQAIPKENEIELTFAQDDYDTLLGYNIYRAESKDGNYVKLNPAILLPTDSTFLDENAEPGKIYWYTYTVVLTDFTESNPAGKVVVTAMDTLAPNMYHTPVNQGYLNNNLVISCTASDNVAISSVTLYYRSVGTTDWESLTMSKQSDKYSATIFGSDLTLDGIEYYIVASDGRNTINKGSAETPYTIIVKDASAISRKGDVDGDGVVTTKDALMLMQCINGDLILSDDEFKRADLNGDNVLNSSEALRILQYINGKVSTLEM